jgi:hypothetical protein
LCFYTTARNNPKKRIKIASSFTIVSMRIKYLEINLAKPRKDLCSEHCKILLKGILKDLNKWKGTCVHGQERFNIMKISILTIVG